MPVTLACEQCGVEFTRPPRDLKRNAAYCSNACRGEAQRRGGNRIQMEDGYIRIYQPGGSTVAEHRVVMERHLGRPLRDDEQVHHIDGVKDNNAIENLQVVTPKEHAEIHLSLGDRWSRDCAACRECGTTERAHLARGLCGRCCRRTYMRKYRSRR